MTSPRRVVFLFLWLHPSCLLSVIRVALAFTQPSLPASHLTSKTQQSNRATNIVALLRACLAAQTFWPVASAHTGRWQNK